MRRTKQRSPADAAARPLRDLTTPKLSARRVIAAGLLQLLLKINVIVSLKFPADLV
jgi:hypothetical protein